MIRFNHWNNYPWENGNFTQNERALLEDNYPEESCMYSLMELMLEALKDKVLQVERTGTRYDIPIKFIKQIYLTCDYCRIELIENKDTFETDLYTGEREKYLGDCIEHKRPEFKII